MRTLGRIKSHLAMEFYKKFIITVIIAAAFICFRLEVEGAISTEELTSEQKRECVKWEEFNDGYCSPGTYKTVQGNCSYCPEGSYMKWFNTCPMCIRFKVCDEGDVVSYPGDTTNDRICADPPPATDPQLIIDSSTPSEAKKHKPFTEESTSPTPDDLPGPTSSEPPDTGKHGNKLSNLGIVLTTVIVVAISIAVVAISIAVVAISIAYVISKYYTSRTQNLSRRESSSSTSTTNDTSEKDEASNATLIKSEDIIEME